MSYMCKLTDRSELSLPSLNEVSSNGLLVSANLIGFFFPTITLPILLFISDITEFDRV